MAEQHTYTIRLGGEGGTTYRVEGWRGLTADEAARALGTVAGYRAHYIRRALVRGIRQSPRGVWELRPAACSWGETPRFLITDDTRTE
jgi:hypothetical protein